MKKEYWELLILDGQRAGPLAVGDVDGDGKQEIISSRRWYRPATFEYGTIEEGISLQCVGVTAGDIDGDGKMEVIGATRRDADSKEYYELYWYKPREDLSRPWAKHRICQERIGQPHDLFVTDMDGDGQNELVAVRMYIPTPGVYIYKPGEDITKEWKENVVQEGLSGDGTVAADFDDDGIPEILAGPFLYKAPPEGPFSDHWTQDEIAPGFRGMCKATMLDITGNGRPDAIIAESEYPDCKVSWFENRMTEDPDNPWIEHHLDSPYDFIHSIDAWHDQNGEAHIFIAEMEKGGWNNPYNYDARLVEFTSPDHGQAWERRLMFKGLGAWEAVVRDIDDDGEVEIVSTGGATYGDQGVHVWKRPENPSFPVRYRHRIIDRRKPWTGTDILAVDVDGDGKKDIVCAAFWYKNPTWERRQIHPIYQIINAYDINGDGRLELIGTKKKAGHEGRWYNGLTSEIYWLKPIDPLEGKWDEHHIGTSTPGSGSHRWPHGTCISPVLPNSRVALIARGSGPLELYQAPDDPRTGPWPKRVFAEAEGCASRMIAHDLTGNGLLDLIAGWKWLENLGDGAFRPHLIAEQFNEKSNPEGLRGGEHLIADINGDGHIDMIACEEHTDYPSKEVKFARVVWFENPSDPKQELWEMHVIDNIRSPHSLAVADLDGDGEPEIVAGEHDPHHPYRGRQRLYVYKKADNQGHAWTRHLIDEGFDHHVGTKLIELEPGRIGIISHGWNEGNYVHLWEPC